MDMKDAVVERYMDFDTFLDTVKKYRELGQLKIISSPEVEIKKGNPWIFVSVFVLFKGRPELWKTDASGSDIRFINRRMGIIDKELEEAIRKVDELQDKRWNFMMNVWRKNPTYENEQTYYRISQPPRTEGARLDFGE